MGFAGFRKHSLFYSSFDLESAKPQGFLQLVVNNELSLFANSFVKIGSKVDEDRYGSGSECHFYLIPSDML